MTCGTDAGQRHTASCTSRHSGLCASLSQCFSSHRESGPVTFRDHAGLTLTARRLVMIQILLQGLKMDPLCSLHYYAPVSRSRTVDLVALEADD